MTGEFHATGPAAGERTQFIVDDRDAWWVRDFNWQADRSRYISTRISTPAGRQRLPLHRMILGLVPGEPLDGEHRDGDPTNNTRENLRVATRTQNIANRRSRRGTDKPKGVWRHNSRWAASIREADGGRLWRMFDTEAEAADWYDQQARRIHGDFAVTARHD